MKIEILDLGINNLTSVQMAFSAKIAQGDSLELISEGNPASKPDLIVLPGLGNFSAGSKALKERKLDTYIRDQEQAGTSVVGICLGMQLLGDSSDEAPGFKGLGLIKGSSERLVKNINARVPNIGWAEISTSGSRLPSLLDPVRDYYFVHSFHFVPTESEVEVGISQHGKRDFISAIRKNKIYGFQFHPEKSSIAGRKLIENLLRMIKDEI